MFNKTYDHYASEIQFLLDFIDSVPNDTQVLDYGCGDGRLLKMLDRKVCVTGVDANESLVDINRKNGFNCLTVSEFGKTTQKYDLIILSHVIEHFDHEQLYSLLNSLLLRLRNNGKLIVFSPLMNPDFYDDFDHIKPYSHIGLDMAFGGYIDDGPIQYVKGTARLKLLRLEYRYSKRRVKYFIPQNRFERKLVECVNKCFLYGYFISPRLFGIATGWMGLFQKLSTDRDTRSISY